MLKVSINFLNQLKSASVCNKNFIKISYNIHLKDFIKSLYFEGLIQSFYIKISFDHKKYFLIFLKYFYGTSVLKKFKYFSKLSSIKYVKFSTISQLNSQKATMAFFLTNQGVFTHIKCKKHLIGGKLIFVS